MQRIAIIGLGLIGGSLGMALKKAVPGKVEITGHDHDRRAISQALKLQAIDRGERNILESVRDVDLVVIATPILAIRDVMKEVSSHLGRGCVVTDTGSTKAQIMAWARELLPSTVDFVGGHPMAGKEVSGVEHADADLFQGATYCICPSPLASQQAIEAVRGLAERIGAVPYFPDPVEHDGLVAAVSHLPIILASALVSIATTSQSWREMSRLASSGFEDSTRLASTDPSMSVGIFLTNREALEHWIDRFIKELEGYKELLKADEEELENDLARVREARERWLGGKETWDGEHMPEIPTVGQQLTGLFVGDRLARRTRDLMNLRRFKSDERPRKNRDDREGEETRG
ncbi:MAG: prephenate dehydrogenase [Dehalococcoidia bacterium]